VSVTLQTWNEHFFVLSTTHLYYTEEQQQDVNDDDVSPEVDEVFCQVPVYCY